MQADMAMKRAPTSADAGKSRQVLLICFLLVMIDGYDTLMMSFLAPQLMAHFQIDPKEMGAIFSIGFAGAIIGALLIGPITDYFGRKPVLIGSLVIAAAATLSCAIAGSVDVLKILRFIAGVALGGAIPSLVALTAEHADPDRQNAAVVRMYIGYPLGAVVGGFVTAYVLQYGWSAVFVGAGLVTLLLLPFAFLVPESQSRTAGKSRASKESLVSSFTGQFAGGRLPATLLLWFGMISMLLLSYFLISWMPTVLAKTGLTPKEATFGGVILNLGGIVGALAIAPLINRFGPFVPAAIMVGLGAVAVALLGQGLSPSAMFILLALVGATVIGGQLNTTAMTVQLYPPQVRGAGVGWTLGIGRLGSIIGPFVGGALLAAQLGWNTLFAIAAIPAAIAAVTFFIIEKVKPR
jgi:AAHS family 4-hydroxybenzoate transporter-like MFS transporter